MGIILDKLTGNPLLIEVKEADLDTALKAKVNQGKIAGIITTTLPSTGIITDKVYEYAGVQGVQITGGTIKDTNGATITTLQNGDSVWYNTATTFWYRIPFQSLANYYTKAEIITETTGKNLFNINASDIAIGYYVATNGTLAASASYNATGYIPVTAETAYYLSYKHNIAWYNSSKVFISASIDNNKAQTSPANAAYLRCTVSLAAWTLFQVELGSIGTSYEAFEIIKILSEEIVLCHHTHTISEVTNLTEQLALKTEMSDYVGKNLFNINASDIAIGYYVNTNGALLASASYNATGYIPVTAETAYYLSYKHNIAWYNSSKVFISSSASTDTNKAQTSPVNAAYLRCTVSVAAWTLFQVEIGTIQTDYEAYGIHKEIDELKIKSENVLNFQEKVEDAIIFSNEISLPSKQYFLGNYENTIYFQAICKKWLPYNFFVQFINGTFINRSKFARITNPVADSSVDAYLYNSNFDIISNKNFNLLVGAQTTDNGALNIVAIGDSLTYNGSYLKKCNDLLPNLNFHGIRIPYGDLTLNAEGRGGWSLNNYFLNLQSTTDSFSPFMHLADPYKYYGNTDFWKKVVNGDVTYSYSGFSAKATEIGFSASTGLKSSPSANDVMYNNANARYEVYNGSAWIAFTAVAGDFSFNFAKYRSIWNITQPNIVTIMLGTNDFRAVENLTTIDNLFILWKSNFETIVSSILADNPICKIALLIPPSVVGSSTDLIDCNIFYQKMNAAMFLARKLMITNFDAREAESIYLVDVGSSLNPEYGISFTTEEKPFEDYAGTETIKLQTNNPHPSTQGYYEMGVRLAGFIQAIR